MRLRLSQPPAGLGLGLGLSLAKNDLRVSKMIQGDIRGFIEL